MYCPQELRTYAVFFLAQLLEKGGSIPHTSLSTAPDVGVRKSKAKPAAVDHMMDRIMVKRTHLDRRCHTRRAYDHTLQQVSYWSSPSFLSSSTTYPLHPTECPAWLWRPLPTAGYKMQREAFKHQTTPVRWATLFSTTFDGVSWRYRFFGRIYELFLFLYVQRDTRLQISKQALTRDSERQLDTVRRCYNRWGVDAFRFFRGMTLFRYHCPCAIALVWRAHPTSSSENLQQVKYHIHVDLYHL